MKLFAIPNLFIHQTPRTCVVIPKNLFPFVLLFSMLLSGGFSFGQVYWNTNGASNTLTNANWGTSAVGPFTTAWSDNSNIVFTANSAITNVTNTAVGNLTVTNSSSIIWAAAGTYATGGAIRTFDIGTGSSLVWNGQTVSTTAGTGFIKNGGGTWNLGGQSNPYPGGFTLNAGTVIIGGINAMGNGGTLTLNGGTVAASSTLNITPRYSGISIGGDVSFGNVSNASNIVFGDNVTLGPGVTRTITLGSSGTYTFSGIISGTGSGITISSTAPGTLVLAGVNTYEGVTTVNGGTLQLTGSLPATNNLVVNGGTFRVSNNQTINSLTVNSGGTVIVDAGVTLTINGISTIDGTLQTAGTISNNNNNTITVNGILQINQGGWPGNTGVYTYAPSATLVFNNSSGSYGINATDTWWPTTNGPSNVTVQGAGGITLNISKAISGLFQAAAGVVNANNLTLSGTTQINAGGSMTGSPTYSSSSTLIYNSGGTYVINNEWTGNSITAGLGIPQNVMIQNNTNLDFPTVNRGCAGNFLISSGNARLNNTSGDLYVAGNFTNNGTFTHNNRALFLNGAAAQTLNGTLSGTGTTNCLPYLLINKTIGSVALNTPVNVTNTLTLTNGNLVLGSNNLAISSGGSISGSFSNSRMIIADGSGNLIYNVLTGFNGTLLYPVGDATGVVEYTPISINLNNTGIAGTLAIRLSDGAHPQVDNPNSNDDLSRYWSCTTIGLSAYTWNAVATYVDADVSGTEANLKMNVWLQAPSNAWVEYPTMVNTTNNTLTSSGGAVGELNGSDITGRVNQLLYYYQTSSTPTDWSVASSWEVSTSSTFASTSPALFAPTNINSVGITIRSGHTLTTTTAVTADDMTIDGILNIYTGAAFVLANGTAATDMTISGTGRLNLNAGTFATNTSSQVAVATGGYWYSALASPSTSYNGTVAFASGSTYEHAVNGGTIPAAVWQGGSPGALCLITGITSSTLGGLNQSFFNFTWNCAQTQRITLSLGVNAPSIAILGDLTIQNTGTNELRLYTETAGGSLTVSGNTLITGGKLSLFGDGTYGGLRTVNLNIKGNLSLTGSGVLNLTGTLVTLSNAFLTYHSCNVYLEGDLTIAGTAQIIQPVTFRVIATFIFRKVTGIQTFSSHSTGVNQAYIGWGIGDISKSGAFSNTLLLNTNFIAKNESVFRVYNKAALSCAEEFYVGGVALGISIDADPPGFTLFSGSTIFLGSKDGITSSGAVGNIRTSGPRNFNAAAHYTYIGTANQVTGNGLPLTITGSLSIANTGLAGSNTVTLTNNTTTSILNLNSGYFAAGTNQNLNISTGGFINGNGGNNPDLPSAGTITFIGSGFTNGNASGNPSLYSVLINGAVDFNGNPNTNSATILNRLQLNFGSSVVNAPFYNAASTLVYNTTGSYNRSVEWGQATAGAAGYPWHVVVQNGTNLNLGNSAPPLLECGGNLTIGVVGGGSGTVNMNSLSQPLIVKGHLTVGDTLTGSPAGTLNLSTVYGGDLHLYGNYSRGKNSAYNDNDRAIYFKGTSDVTINTPVETISPGIPSQNFSYARLDKTNGTEQITLNCPLGISKEISFTKGILNTSVTNLVTITATPAAAVLGGNLNSYVNGPMKRYTSGSLAGAYLFPLGHVASNRYKPVTLTTINNLASGDNFTGRYFYTAPPQIGADNFLTNLLGIVSTEYWQLDRNAGSTKGKITLPYTNPGTGYWRDVNGNATSSCSDCYVAVVKRSASNGTGTWDFTATGGFSTSTVPPETRLYADPGDIISKEVSAFSPFTIGFAYNVILPVKLLSFTGQFVIGDGKLEWKVADTKDLDGFELEYSTDGRRYTGLATVAANGATNYKFLHGNLPDGTNYYRLMVKDKQGKTFYSQVVLLTVGGMHTVITGLMNNPVGMEITPLIVSASAQRVKATITDATGRLMARQEGQLFQGGNQWKIRAGLLANGSYFITIITSDGVKATLRFIKH